MESASNRPVETASESYPTIAATATAVPPHLITRDDVKYYMGRVFDIPDRKLEAMMTVVDNAQVHKRHSIFPLNTPSSHGRFPRPTRSTRNTPLHSGGVWQRNAWQRLVWFQPTWISLLPSLVRAT